MTRESNQENRTETSQVQPSGAKEQDTWGRDA